MSSQRQFTAGGEKSEPVIGRVGCGGKNERGFRQVRPSGHAQHGFVVQPLTIENHGYRVALIGLGREDIDLGERA